MVFKKRLILILALKKLKKWLYIWYFKSNDRHFWEKYLSSEKIKEIFNVEIQNAFWGFNVKDIHFDTHQWADEFPNLIAHAGGTYRGQSYNTFYTNSLERKKLC